ncbi:S9 family peptidase [Marinicauda salina]|uniref:prolyl oligopeptidase n=1 Tax=Marinicauda salina TaxID=2135793 RepID=A0A2U2BY18_9PROT|nr:prolyl oligopeptidase family serine peptidase [Marinicauda salina]PWE18879.1 S9 family peptidase [Marinicauda salina]
MRLALSVFAAAFLLAACDPAETPDATETDAAAAPRETAGPAAPDYPETRRGDVVDVYQSAAHGEVEVADPYRWLEQDVREAPEVAEWVEAQSAVTQDYLDQLPGRDAIAERLGELWNYERYGLPERRGDRYFYTRNDGLQDQSVLMVQDGLDGAPRALLDPNTWSEDGTLALAAWEPSPDGSLVAFFEQDGGSDWRTLRIVDVETGERLDDSVRWVKFSDIAWAADGSGVYYSRYPEPAEGEEFTSLNTDQAVYFHEVGTGQDEDREVISDPDNPEVGWNAEVSHDGRYLVLTTWTGTDGNGVRVLDREAPDAEPVTLFEGFDNNHLYVGNTGETFFFHTDLDAPNGRIVAVSLSDPDTLVDVIAEGEHPITDASHVGGHLIVETMRDVASAVTVYTTDGEPVREVELPGLGVASGFEGDPARAETFFSYESLNQPAALYRYDVETGEAETFRAPELAFDPDDYVVSRTFYESTGGARIPLFIAHHRDVDPNGARPTLIYGYGGFAITRRPDFDPPRLQWMEMGGVYAIANLRGGSAYGRDWHNAGRLENKQNVFDDFINAGRAMIEMGWTSPDHLAIHGRSNGGLLVGAVANQAPDLFAAALPAVGVMDMLRFNQFTAGRFWVDDYGSPQDPEMFDVLHAYSPYHNIPETGEYPATLITTADTDDRVVPGHSFKYAAALQAADTGDAPTLIRIETRAGHGSGTPVSKLIDKAADRWAFIAWHTGLETPAAGGGEAE